MHIIRIGDGGGGGGGGCRWRGRALAIGMNFQCEQNVRTSAFQKMHYVAEQSALDGGSCAENQYVGLLCLSVLLVVTTVPAAKLN